MSWQTSTYDILQLCFCLFLLLSCRLSSAERNYDIGNWELLAVNLAFKEWCHWLVGAAQSLFIWKYQKNLSYISPQSHPDLILSTACFAASINWKIESLIKNAVSTTNLGKGPTKLFYPDSISSQMLLCAHSSCLTCHSGVNQMSIRGFGGPPCAQNKSLITPTSGLLFPLPLPQSQVTFFSHHFGFWKWHSKMKR